MGLTRLTYQSKTQDPETAAGPCVLCGQENDILLYKRQVTIKLNFMIPWGKYQEHIAHCPHCDRQYQTDADLTADLRPTRRAKVFSWAAWISLIIPFVNVIMQLIALKVLPKTSNHHRQWAKIGLIPSGFISLLLLITLILPDIIR